jgi:hypothetical protein
MVTFLAGLLMGGLVGVVLERAVGQPLDRLVLHPLRERRQMRALRAAAAAAGVVDECAVVAGTAIFVSQFAPAGFPHHHLTGLVDETEPDFAKSVSDSSWSSIFPSVVSLNQSADAWKKQLDADPHFWNGTSLSLVSCHVSRSPLEEDPILTLTFREIEYAVACAIEEAWTSLSIEDRRRADGEQLRAVDPLLSHGFRLNCTVETADGFTVITRRSSHARGWSGFKHIAFNEGLSVLDRRPGGRVDVIGGFRRGLHEELGLDSGSIEGFDRRLTVHSLVLDLDRYQWGMLAHLDLRGTAVTSVAIQTARTLGGAADDWEASALSFVPFTASPDAVIRELADPSNWVSHGLLNLALSAICRHPSQADRIREALASGAAQANL